MISGSEFVNVEFTPFTIHDEKIRNHLRETATKSAKIHSYGAKVGTFAHKSDSITIFAF